MASYRMIITCDYPYFMLSFAGGYRTGLSIYVTEGCFRAEHRKESKRSYPVEVRALPEVPIHRCVIGSIYQ